jgi:hypothetical protein
MHFGDFDRLGLVPNLPPRAELPSALRLALAMTSLLPVELVVWVATAAAPELRARQKRAAGQRRRNKTGVAAERAGQLVRLIALRLDRLEAPELAVTHQPSAPPPPPGTQLRLRME